MSTWTTAQRTARMSPSVIREILKVAERPGVRSMAGGLPSPDTFPVEALNAACDTVLRVHGREALQYASSEGFLPLREWVVARLGRAGLAVTPEQVLITTGSQQGLDLVGKVLIDAGAPVAVEAPTYLGALQAFVPYEPAFTGLDCDAGRPPARIGGQPAGAGARHPVRLPAAELPESHRPADTGGAARRAGRRRAVGGRADRRGQPLRRPLVRRRAAGAAERPLARGRHLPRVVLQGAHPGIPARVHRGADGPVPRRSCRPSRPPTSTRPASTSGWSTRWSRTGSSTGISRRSAIAIAASAT